MMMQAIAESGAGMSGASSVHIPVFSVQPVVLFGTQEQKQRILPPVVSGEDQVCFAVTEPNAGLNTTELKTRAERARRRLPGQRREDLDLRPRRSPTRCCCSRAPRRSTRSSARPKGSRCSTPTWIDRKIEVRLIHKMGRHAVDSNMLFIQDLWIPEEDRIGAEGEGFKIILHGLNPERVLIAAEAIGIGRVGDRSGPPAMRASASCSTGRSA